MVISMATCVVCVRAVFMCWLMASVLYVVQQSTYHFVLLRHLCVGFLRWYFTHNTSLQLPCAVCSTALKASSVFTEMASDELALRNVWHNTSSIGRLCNDYCFYFVAVQECEQNSKYVKQSTDHITTTYQIFSYDTQPISYTDHTMLSSTVDG